MKFWVCVIVASWLAMPCCSWSEESNATSPIHTAVIGDRALSQLPWHSEAETAPSAMRALEGLFVCFAVLAGGIYLLKRFRSGVGIPSSARTLRIIERLPLSPKHALVLVDADGSRLLIAMVPEKM